MPRLVVMPLVVFVLVFGVGVRGGPNADAGAISQTLALRGTIVGPSSVIPDGAVEINGDKIASVSSTPGSNAIPVDGVIFPGLIDLHDHFTWNVLPRWTPPSRFGNRYEWQEHPDYALRLAGVHYALTAGGLGCDMNRYAEIKAIVNGATSGVGAFSTTTENACIAGLMRNLDLLSDLPAAPPPNSERLRNAIFPFELNADGEAAIRAVDPAAPDGSPTLRAVIMHVGEGIDAAARREFRMLRSHGFIKPGVSIAHAVGFSSAQFTELAAAKVGLVWSPRSNIELYGRTSDVVAAKAAGMTIAIAPDWSPTGSSGMLEELSTAWRINVGQLSGAFSDAEFSHMVTANPAQLAAVSGRLGVIAPNAMADLLIMRRKEKTAYQPLVRSNAADVLLVLIGGQPIYGDPALMSRLLPNVALESITVCGETKVLNASGGVVAQSFGAVSQKLRTALVAVGSDLAPLAECR
jgi:cytosine/adenosine deaminase-related metal-dependent hydrolase